MDINIQDSEKALTEVDLVRLEEQIQHRIPDAYRVFLLNHNGGYPEPSDFKIDSDTEESTQISSVDWFLGIGGQESTELKYCIETYKGRLPKSLFPVARDPGGSLICISTKKDDLGKVYFWEHEEEVEDSEEPNESNLYLIADSFEAFLNSLS